MTFPETSQPISDEQLARRLAEAPQEEVDAETVARILAAEAEPGETVSHGELRKRLGL
jgi:biotin carboxyl carrier protein